MKAMACEMCTSNDIVKEGGMYVCQHCGTKYSVEEARKLFAGDTVVIDHSEELKNLYILARRARDTDQSENALKYYEQIVVMDPLSWEAYFYSIYYQAVNESSTDMKHAVNRLHRVEADVLKLVLEQADDDAQTRDILKEITDRMIALSRQMFNASNEQYYRIDPKLRAQYRDSYVGNSRTARDLLFRFGDLIIELFGEEYASDFAVPCWEMGIKEHKVLCGTGLNMGDSWNSLDLYEEKVRHYHMTASKSDHAWNYTAAASTQNTALQSKSASRNQKKKNSTLIWLLIGICAVASVLFSLIFLLMLSEV